MIGSISDILTSAQGSVGDASGSVLDVINLGFGSLQGLFGTGN